MMDDMAIIDTNLRKAKKKHRNCFEFGCSGNEAAIIHHISDLMLPQIENWIVSVTFYHLLVSPRPQALCHLPGLAKKCAAAKQTSIRT
jgi:hypothetical protein